jgi:capsular exopolysaccharide synthesis family protein
MEIRQYFEPLIKWWKLVVVACILAAISSYLVVRQQPPIFQTSTVLVIGSAVYEPNPSGGELGMAQQLATYYADIAQRDVVRSETMEALGLTWLPQYTVATVPNSQILEISVTDTDPQRAQAVANELANQLIKQSPSNPDLQEQQHQQFILQQIALLETQIEDTLDEIAQKEAELGSLNSARQISQTQAEITTLQQKLTTLQTNYAGLVTASSGQNANSMSVIQPAPLPVRPIGPNRMMVVLMSLAIALLVSAGAAYLIEFLDDTIRNSDDVSKHLELPVIGLIPEMDHNGESKSDLLIRDVKSMEAEAFRALRMNVDFLQLHTPIKSLLVASVGKTEGKSMISSNLALALARSCKETLLLDADLRRPSLHKYVNLPNDLGLSNLFLNDAPVEDFIVGTEQEHLEVMTTGATPPNPGDLISSKKMDDILSALKAQYDIVVVDGPPVMVTDATILSSKVDAVLLVIGAGRTRRSEAATAVKQLERAGARVIGAVMNRVTEKKSSYYRMYQYDYGLENTNGHAAKSSRFKLPFGRKASKPSAAKLASEVERAEPLPEES